MDEIFHFPTAIPHDPIIDEWLSTRSDALRPLVQTWYARLRQCGPDIREVMHDGCPTACVDDGAFAYVNAFKAHVNVGFFFGAFLPDPNGLLEGAGKRMRHVKLRPGEPVDAEALSRLIDAAYQDLRVRLKG